MIIGVQTNSLLMVFRAICVIMVLGFKRQLSTEFNMDNEDAKSVLKTLKDKIKHELGDNFIGAYVHGSFATGDVTDWSDLDIVIVIKKDISVRSIASLQKLHCKLHNELGSPWGQRIELSYVPIDIFRKQTAYPRDPVDESRSDNWIDPSTQFQLHFYPFWYLDNGAKELVRSEHDNTQIVRWTVREKGIVLEGPDPKKIIDPITRADLVHDLQRTFAMIAEKWNNPKSLNLLWMQTFFVTLCCRAQHCLQTGTIASKKVASEWAAQTLDAKYRNMIKLAYKHWTNDRASLFEKPAVPDLVALTISLITDTTLALSSFDDSVASVEINGKEGQRPTIF